MLALVEIAAAAAAVAVVAHRDAAPAAFAGIASMRTDFAVVDGVAVVGHSCVDSNRAWIGQTVVFETSCRTWVMKGLVLGRVALDIRQRIAGRDAASKDRYRARGA